MTGLIFLTGSCDTAVIAGGVWERDTDRNVAAAITDGAQERG